MASRNDTAGTTVSSGLPSNKTEKAMTQAKELTEVKGGQLPVHLQGGKTASLGNIDRSDLIMPRVRLLQGISPECETFEKARQGNFWHTMADENLGPSLRCVVIAIRKSVVLWAPRGDERGILARAPDGVNWDIKDDFEVKPKKSQKKIVWSTKSGSVAESGLLEFGSEIPDDPRSAPAAALQYNILMFFPDFEDYSPAIVLNTRSGVKKAKSLISKLEMSSIDHYLQLFTMSASKETTPDGDFFNYNYVRDGYVDEKLAPRMKKLYEKFGAADFRASDENDDEDAKSSAPGVGKTPF